MTTTSTLNWSDTDERDRDNVARIIGLFVEDGHTIVDDRGNTLTWTDAVSLAMSLADVPPVKAGLVLDILEGMVPVQ